MADITTVARHDQNATGEQELVFLPRVDICETDAELVLCADLPGVRPEDIDLRFENGKLTLHGKVQPRGEGRALHRQEYQIGDFQRTFQVHDSIDGSRISADCKNGVLTVHLPKAAEFQPRQIKVQGS